MLKNDIGGGDGIKAKITKNGAAIWPTSGTPQTIAYNDETGVNTNLDSISVAANDVIRFEVNNGGNGNSANDLTSWSPSVAYTSYTSIKDWNFNTGGNFEGWTMYYQVSGTVSGGALNLTTSGIDPQILSPDNLGITAPATYNKVRIRMENNTSQTSANLFFLTNSNITWGGTKLKAFTITANSGYFDYIVDMSTVASWTGTIKQLRIDPLDPAGGSGQTVNIDYIRVTDNGGDASLKADWKLNETSGTTASDSSGNNINGTLTNGPTWVTGKSGNAVRLDGVM